MSYPLIIDAYAHISPPKYTEFVRQKYPVMYNNMLGRCVPLYDMDHRFRIMDKYQGLVQVLTVGPVPPIEDFANAQQTVVGRRRLEVSDCFETEGDLVGRRQIQDETDRVG